MAFFLAWLPQGFYPRTAPVIRKWKLHTCQHLIRHIKTLQFFSNHEYHSIRFDYQLSIYGYNYKYEYGHVGTTQAFTPLSSLGSQQGQVASPSGCQPYQVMFLILVTKINKTSKLIQLLTLALTSFKSFLNSFSLLCFSSCQFKHTPFTHSFVTPKLKTESWNSTAENNDSCQTTSYSAFSLRFASAFLQRENNKYS